MGYRQILDADRGHEEAHEGLIAIHRKAQQWPELVAALVASRRRRRQQPANARSARRGRRELFEVHLNDPGARQRGVREGARGRPEPRQGGRRDGADRREHGGLRDPRGHPRAAARRSRRGRDKTEALLKSPSSTKTSSEDLARGRAPLRGGARDRAHDHLAALKGLDRIYNRTSKYRELLENLEKQVEVAATPRQKINLYERMASLHDEEFLDHARAAECLECILTLDPDNDAALSTSSSAITARSGAGRA